LALRAGRGHGGAPGSDQEDRRRQAAREPPRLSHPNLVGVRRPQGRGARPRPRGGGQADGKRVSTESLFDLEAALKDEARRRGWLERVLRIRPTAVVSLVSMAVLVGVWALLSLGHLVSNRFL